MAEVESPKVKVGDELAFFSGWYGYIIRKVVKVSKTGRLTMDSGIVLDPGTLRVRGDRSTRSMHGHRGEIVTPEIRKEVAARQAKEFIRSLDNWACSKLRTEDELIDLAAIVREFMNKRKGSDAGVEYAKGD